LLSKTTTLVLPITGKQSEFLKKKNALQQKFLANNFDEHKKKIN